MRALACRTARDIYSGYVYAWNAIRTHAFEPPWPALLLTAWVVFVVVKFG